MLKPIRVSDFEAIAKQQLPKDVYDYYAGGAGDEITLLDNEVAFDRIRILPDAFNDCSKVSEQISVEISGERVPFPIGIAPTALHRMADPMGELATARAAARLGAIAIFSTCSSVSLEKIAEAAGPDANIWFQLYVMKDRELTLQLIRRAEKAGFKALVVTIDAPVQGRRVSDYVFCSMRG